MKRDFGFFCRRYEQIEDDFLKILDFIDIKENFQKPCYKIGSSKLMDFCLKVGTEVETLFGIILESPEFDSEPDITKYRKRKNQNIQVYIDLIEPKYNLSDYKLTINPINRNIQPFTDFKRSKAPQWFQIYSRHKHNKIELIERWNLKHSLFSLGGLLILVVNIPLPSSDSYRFYLMRRRVFGKLYHR